MPTKRLLLLCLFAPAAAGAQVIPYDVRDLAPGVFAVVRRPPPGAVSDGNSLVIINDDDVVVVDANIFPTSARETIAEIRKRTAKPVRYVVNTHWHSDHHYGNAEFRTAYPGVEFVQHPVTSAEINTRDVPALANNLAVTYPDLAARYRRALTTGRTSRGDTVTQEMRAIFSETLKTYETFLSDMAGVPLIPATIAVSDSLVLQRGARRIVIKHLGLGNTAGDLIVHLPVERIIATGDLVVSPVPFGFYSHLGSWSTTLRTLRSLDAAQIVPGHGEVHADWTYVDGLIRTISAIWTQVAASVRAGADLTATASRVNIDSLRALFPGVGRETLDAMFVSPGTQAAYADLTADSLVAIGDEGRVLDVVNGLFDAMERKDTAAMRQLFEPNARLVGVRPNASGPRLQALSWDEFARAVASSTRGPWIERAFAPRVRIRGTLAEVWTEYDFHFGQTPSHCGVDSIQLLQLSAGWKIVSLADTYETNGCPARQAPRGNR
jgi:cyclase